MNTPRSRAVLPCLLLSVLFFAGFGVLAFNVKAENDLTRLDGEISQSLHEHAQSAPGLKAFFKVVTDVGPWPALAGFLGLAAWMCYRGQDRLLAIVCLVMLAAGLFMNDGVKEIIKRPRPPFPDPPKSWSFPSGHTTRSVVGYGFLAYLLVVVLPGRGSRWAAVALLALCALAVGFSRMYLTQHYFSDVLGSLTLGIGWLALWIALIEGLGWRKPRAPNQIPPAN